MSNSFKIQPEHIETEAKIDTHLTWLILWTLLALHRHFDSSGIFDCHTALCDVITQIFSVYSVCNSHCVYQPKRIREVSQLNKLSVMVQFCSISLYSTFTPPFYNEHEHQWKHENCCLNSISTVLKIDCKGNLQSQEKTSPIKVRIQQFWVGKYTSLSLKVRNYLITR